MLWILCVRKGGPGAACQKCLPRGARTAGSAQDDESVRQGVGSSARKLGAVGTRAILARGGTCVWGMGGGGTRTNPSPCRGKNAGPSLRSGKTGDVRASCHGTVAASSGTVAASEPARCLATRPGKFLVSPPGRRVTARGDNPSPSPPRRAGFRPRRGRTPLLARARTKDKGPQGSGRLTAPRGSPAADLSLGRRSLDTDDPPAVGK